PVMCQANVVRERLVGGFVRQIVGDVGEESALGFEFIYQAQRVCDARVRGMGPVPQRVEKKDVETAQLLHGLRRNLTEVGEGSRRSEAKAVDFRVTVDDFHRLKPRSEQVQRAVDPLHLYAGDAPVLVRSVKNVTEDSLHGFRSRVKGVQRDLLLAAETKRTHVVETQDVVGVSMGINDGVDVRNVLADGLLAKVRRGVNDYTAAAVLQHDRGASAAVTRIAGMTDGARAPDGGHAHGRSAT